MPKVAITRVTGLSVTPNTTTTISKNTGLYAPQLTPAQIAAIPAATLVNGAIVYNTTTNTYQVYQNAAWTNLTTGAANILTAPSFATLSAPAVANGAIYYDTDTNLVTIANNAAYASVYTSPLAQVGNLVVQSLNADPAPAIAGEIYNNTANGGNVLKGYTNINGAAAWGSVYLSPGTTNHLITQTANANPANTNGTIYYSNAANTNHFKAFQNANWVNIYTTTSIATGAGFGNGDMAFGLPSGIKANVEVAGNQVDGFTYYSTATTEIRAYTNAAWSTLYASPSTATGVGLTAGNNAFTLSNGPSGAVEVAANEVNGFMYYNTTGNNIRARVNGAWTTVTVV